MRAALYAASVLLLSGAAALAYLGSRPAPVHPPAPAVTIEPAVHDFGEVLRDKVVTATFIVRNTHPVPIRVGPLSKGCSCSEAVVTPEVIPAGGMAELRVTWQLRGKRGASSESVSASWRAGLEVAGSIQCRLKADVHGHIDVLPDSVELSPTNRQAIVTLKSRTGRPFQLTGATTNDPMLRAEVQSENELLVSLRPGAYQWQSGKLFARIDTNLPDEPEVLVWIRLKR